MTAALPEQDLLLRPVADFARLGLTDTALPESRVSLSAVRDRLASNLTGQVRGTVHQSALLVDVLTALDLRLPVPAQRRLEALALRELARAALVTKQHRQLADLIAAQGIVALPVRGWPLASRIYCNPLTRHCHALRWLVPDPTGRTKIDQLLEDAGWNQVLPVPALEVHKRLRIGRGLVAVEVLDRPFPWSNAGIEPSLTASPEWIAAEIIGASLYEGGAPNFRWTVDLALLLRAETLDTRVFAAHVIRFGFGGAARARLALVAKLVDPKDAQLHAVLAALAAALPDRDDPGVVSLLRVRRLSQGALRDLMLEAPRHPGIALAAFRLRRQRSRAFARTLGLRRKLSDLSDPRVSIDPAFRLRWEGGAPEIADSDEP